MKSFPNLNKLSKMPVSFHLMPSSLGFGQKIISHNLTHPLNITRKPQTTQKDTSSFSLESPHFVCRKMIRRNLNIAVTISLYIHVEDAKNSCAKAKVCDSYRRRTLISTSCFGTVSRVVLRQKPTSCVNRLTKRMQSESSTISQKSRQTLRSPKKKKNLLIT